MSPRLSIRQGLLAVALLAAIISAVSVWSVTRVLSFSRETRLERARDAVTNELDRLAADPAGTSESRAVATIGMRGGRLPEGVPLPDIDGPYVAQLNAVIERARATGTRVVETVAVGEQTAVLGALPDPSGAVAWGAYLVRAPSYQSSFRLSIFFVTGATSLLVAISIFWVVSVRRGAESLRASLAALAKDLRAPVARPSIRELADTAAGVEALARELARAEDERQRLGVKLAERERLAALGRVVAGVAHEVRNPLASIKLRLDLAAMGDLPPGLAEELALASSEIARLDRLVADLLVVAGRRSGPRATTDLGELVRERLRLIEPWAEERGVTVKCSGSSVAEIDRDGLSQAIDNLVRNAVEASPVGGEVTVEIDEHDDKARIKVVDRGPGVEGSRVSELFEPFFTTKPGGTGLGLALSRAVANAHGGELAYERTSGASAFELEVPRKSATDLEAAE